MAIGDAGQIPGQDDGGAPGGPPGAAPGGGGPPGSPGGGPPGGVLAALQRAQQQPGPTMPGYGDQGDSLMKVKAAAEGLALALPGLGVGTPIYTEVARILSRLGKHLPQGAPTIGVQKTFHQDLGRRMQKNWLLQQVMANQGADGGQQQPVPQTPMPGA